jgi:hypothetical protein
MPNPGKEKPRSNWLSLNTYFLDFVVGVNPCPVRPVVKSVVVLVSDLVDQVKPRLSLIEDASTLGWQSFVSRSRKWRQLVTLSVRLELRIKCPQLL